MKLDEKPKKITKWSEGFYHTLQTLDTWRESESTGNGNNIRNFNKLAPVWQDPPLSEIDHDLVERTLKKIRFNTGNSNRTLNRAVSTVKKVLQKRFQALYTLTELVEYKQLVKNKILITII